MEPRGTVAGTLVGRKMAATAERWPYSFYARWMSYVNRNQRGPAVKPNRKRPPRLPLRESPLGSCHRDGTFESRAGDIGVPDRSPALTRHDAEFHLWPVQDSEHWTGCPEMKRPLSGFVSRQPLRDVHLRTSAGGLLYKQTRGCQAEFGLAENATAALAGGRRSLSTHGG